MKTSWKLAVSLLVLASSFLLLRVNGWFSLGIVVALPVSILYWFDYGVELRQQPDASRARRVLGLVMGIPQALFGGVCFLIGVSMLIWVLYNSLWKRLPEYDGSFLTFGLGPVFVLFGAGLVVDAFRRRPPNE